MAEGERTVLDVSGLPRHEPGTSQLTWWGNIGFMITEGTTLAICAVTFIYLRRNFASWPPLRTEAPDLIIPTLSMLALVVASTVAWLEGRAARVLDRHGVRFFGTAGVVADIVVLILRGLELNSLNTRWDSDAYGSIVWFTLGFHTTLLVLVFFEDFFYMLVAWLKPLSQKHAAHIVEKAEYAVFVAAVWVVLYVLIYWSPRFL